MPLLVATLHTRDVCSYLPDLLLTPASLVLIDFIFFSLQQKSDMKLFFFLRSLEPARGYPYTTLTMGCSDRHRRNCEVINVAPYVSWPFEAQRQLNIPPALALRCLLFFTCRFVSSNSHNQHLYLPLTSCSSAPHSLTPSASLSARDQVSHP